MSVPLSAWTQTSFPDVDSILLAWHERRISHHLDHLAEVRDQTEGAGERLEAVLRAFALISHTSRGHHDGDLAAFLHRDEHVNEAQRRLHGMVEALLAEGAQTGAVRGDITPGELASYCLHALTAAGDLPSKAAVHRLVAVTLAGVRPGPADVPEGSPQADGTGNSTPPADHHGHHSAHDHHLGG
jgi:hypothetical protein